MRLSTRGRFAITAMIDLALRQSNTPVPLQDLAVRHRISMSYLEQMFAKLGQCPGNDTGSVGRSAIYCCGLSENRDAAKPCTRAKGQGLSG